MLTSRVLAIAKVLSRDIQERSQAIKRIKRWGWYDLKRDNRWRIAMARLVHEVWEENAGGMLLHACCLAGPRGDGCRSNLTPDARLIQTFEASSHFEAMTLYNSMLGRERYTTDQPLDHEPYPEQWWREQQGQTPEDAHEG